VLRVTADGRVSTWITRQEIDRQIGALAGVGREGLYGDEFWGLCVEPDGAVLIADPSQRRVVRVTPAGAASVVLPARGAVVAGGRDAARGRGAGDGIGL